MAEFPAPIWLQRSFLAMYVLLCVTLGVALMALPWLGNWFDDGLVARWPSLQHLLQHGFVRGAVSGLGLIDIWLGLAEVARFRNRRTETPGANWTDGNFHDRTS